jgi:polar amino acid transport system substrate-binding protein
MFYPLSLGFFAPWPRHKSGVSLKIRFFIAIASALLLGASGVYATETPTLVLNDTNDPPFTTPDQNGFLDVVASEAFRRVGLKLRLVKLPAERALLNANAGIEDGDLTRIAGLEVQYPNLIRVPEKLLDWTFTAFSKDAALPARWEIIRQHPVAHIKGWKIYEQHLTGASQVISVDDAAQMFRLLDLNRIEIALYSRWMGEALIRQQGIKGVYALEPPLATREMFIYLHKRHAALVPKLAEALRAIKAEGLYDRLYRDKVLLLTGAAPK